MMFQQVPLPLSSASSLAPLLYYFSTKIIARVFLSSSSLEKPSRPYAISSSTPPLLLRVEVGLDWVATYLDCCGGNETMLDFILSDMLVR